MVHLYPQNKTTLFQDLHLFSDLQTTSMEKKYYFCFIVFFSPFRNQLETESLVKFQMVTDTRRQVTNIRIQQLTLF